MNTVLKLFLVFFMLFSFCDAREDLRSYYNDIETPAVWKNPRSVTVYLEEDKTKGIVSTTDRFFSKSIAPFYGSIAICVLVVLLVLNWELLLQLLCCSD